MNHPVPWRRLLTHLTGFAYYRSLPGAIEAAATHLTEVAARTNTEYLREC